MYSLFIDFLFYSFSLRVVVCSLSVGWSGKNKATNVNTICECDRARAFYRAGVKNLLDRGIEYIRHVNAVAPKLMHSTYRTAG